MPPDVSRRPDILPLTCNLPARRMDFAISIPEVSPKFSLKMALRYFAHLIPLLIFTAPNRLGFVPVSK